jgi:hypothetical protein
MNLHVFDPQVEIQAPALIAVTSFDTGMLYKTAFAQMFGGRTNVRILKDTDGTLATVQAARKSADKEQVINVWIIGTDEESFDGRDLPWGKRLDGFFDAIIHIEGYTDHGVLLNVQKCPSWKTPSLMELLVNYDRIRIPQEAPGLPS